MKVSIGFDGWLLLIGIVLSHNRISGIICIVCALVHELGHLVAARFLKIKIKELKLGFGGARIYPEEELLSYKKEFFLCIWGPVFNILFAFLSLIVLFFIYREESPSADDLITQIFMLLSGEDMSAGAVMCLSVVVSLMQAIVNLLPVESFDGGRMMVALFSSLGNADAGYRAEKCATVLSAVCLWLVSVYMLLRFGTGVGIFVFAGCIFARMISKKGNKY